VLDNNNEYAKPTIPNNSPRENIPITNTNIEIIFVMKICQLFSCARNCETYKVEIVAGIIEREIKGINSSDSEYSGNKIGII
jgi:hypothetical protein|tara:strand:+ start:960 stop:1205 length:246 start_codon:yes stop_codon:yes gene_type:complete